MWGFSGLLWWLGAAIFVVLLHLIRLTRQRRIEWGAMSFLLQSLRTQRVRIFWEHWLLILLRTLAVILIVLLFARPLTSHDFPDFWERGTEQIILLDDSFSMTERAASGRTLWDEALEKLQTFLQNRSPRDSVTLIRFSRAAAIAQDATFEHLTPNAILESLAEKKMWSCSESAATLKEAESALAQILSRRSESQKIAVTVFSDFRFSDFRERDGNSAVFASWKRFLPHGKVRFIPCEFGEETANTQKINLGIDRVSLVDGVHAAAVEQLLEVVLRSSAHENASGKNGGNISSDVGTLNIFVDDEPQIPLAIPPISAGKSITLRVPIRVRPESGQTTAWQNTASPTSFTAAALGCSISQTEIFNRITTAEAARDYRVHLELPSDSVAADNHFFGVLKLPPQIIVGVLASSEKSQRAARIISAALAPSGVESGIRVTQISPELLTHSQTLAPISLLILLDTGALNLSQIRMLENFISAGGNLLFFLSEETQIVPFNENFYRDGAGIFPCALANVETLQSDYFSALADLSVTSSPIFRGFEADEKSSLASIKIEKYFSLLEENRGENPAENSPAEKKHVEILASLRNVKILASLRNGAPLVIEKSHFNKDENSGGVIAFLTTASGEWNSWCRHPSFVVVMQNLVAYFTRSANLLTQHQVDAPIRIASDAAIFRDVFTLSHAENDSRTVSITLPISEPFSLERSGFWTITRTKHGGENASQTLGICVDAAEGDLQLAPREDLVASLRRAGIEWNDAQGEIFSSGNDFLCDAILALVLICFAGEMLLARHLAPPRKL